MPESYFGVCDANTIEDVGTPGGRAEQAGRPLPWDAGDVRRLHRGGGAMRYLTYVALLLTMGCSTGFYTHMDRNEAGELVVTSRERYFILGSFKADKDKVEIKRAASGVSRN